MIAQELAILLKVSVSDRSTNRLVPYYLLTVMNFSALTTCLLDFFGIPRSWGTTLLDYPEYLVEVAPA